MISTFHGLEVARKGMMTQQAALHTTGHNIANANTPGYSRQRVNFAQTNPFPSPGLNRPQIPGQIGTGVKASDIQRIRDSFVDMQFRSESSKLGYWQAKAEQLSQMEDIMNEPSDVGLAKSLDQFWNALQDLATQPQNDGARRVVRERGISLANTFNYMSNSLKAIQKDYRNEIDVTQQRVNSLLRQVNQINKQIGSIEPHGYLPNDLYDERDRIIDELSSIVNIKIDVRPSGGLASTNAEGLYDIYLADPKGDTLRDSANKPIKLVDSLSGKANGFHIQYENRAELDSPVSQIKFFELKENEEGFVGIKHSIEADTATNSIYNLIEFSAFSSNGKLKGNIEGYGYVDKSGLTPVTKGLYNQMLADLDQMAFTFASHFNQVHQSGWSLNEIRNGSKSGMDFFSFNGGVPTEANPKGAAAIIKISQSILDDPQNIAAAAEGNVLAGGMIRTSSVNTATVGNPSFTGIYDSTNLPDSFKSFSSDIAEMKINMKFTFDSTTNTGSWAHQLTAYDKDGKELGVADWKGFTEKEVSVAGVKINTSLVSKPNSGDEWTITFPAQGVKSSDEAFIGNGSNALKLSNVKDAIINYGGTLTNVHSFYQGMIGRLGDNAGEANKMTQTAGVLKDSVEQRRMSISSVSLDEEMTNMIKFQHAYNAAARNITMVDEMLDKIINGMGVVGR
ncbi:flagellar hook-associated protein FlgK [Bacillus sp. 31A1R]|uniref:Flagellar hook-associated protein 1 n=1 Tax=Robertmurraya mangrovi TaxID=3098077 RepID=A0ABU5IXX3_9BACI|nr:flagellar hook-associated protein FlgK [Bacillus sp. 31A1R]MDZ5471952.1 flagellar hook-associated protein FlgK [Bacillus sp. 31A1R]